MDEQREYGIGTLQMMSCESDKMNLCTLQKDRDMEVFAMRDGCLRGRPYYVLSFYASQFIDNHYVKDHWKHRHLLSRVQTGFVS